MTSTQKNLDEHLKKLETVKKIQKVRNEIKEDGFDFDLFEVEKISLGYLFSSIATYIVLTAVITFFLEKGDKSYTFIFVLGVLACVWMTGCTQLRFERKFITSTVLTFSIVLFSVSSGITSPQEAVKVLLGEPSKIIEEPTQDINNSE
jgi:hypothetical protein